MQHAHSRPPSLTPEQGRRRNPTSPYTHGLGYKRTLTTLPSNDRIIPRSEWHFCIIVPLLTRLARLVLWGAKIAQSPPSVTYEEAISSDDRGLHKWLSKIVSPSCPVSNYAQELIGFAKDRFGFCFVSGVPATTEATEELAKRISFIRETQCMVPPLRSLVLKLTCQQMGSSGTSPPISPKVTRPTQH